MPINWWREKHIVYFHKWNTIQQSRKWTTYKCNNLNESQKHYSKYKSGTKNYILYDSVIGYHRKGKTIAIESSKWLHNAEDRGKGTLANKHEETFWGDRNVIYTDGGGGDGGDTIVYLYQNSSSCILKIGIFYYM